MAALAASLQDYVINQYLLALEARRQGSNDVDEASVRARLQQLRERFASQAALTAFCVEVGLDEEQLRNMLQRDLVNERFIAARLQLRRGLAPARYAGRPESLFRQRPSKRQQRRLQKPPRLLF